MSDKDENVANNEEHQAVKAEGTDKQEQHDSIDEKLSALVVTVQSIVGESSKNTRSSLRSTRIAVVAALAVACTAGFISLSAAKRMDTVSANQSPVVAQAAEPGAGYKFKSEEDFQQAVISSLNQMVKDKQEQEMADKLAKQKLAPEEVPGDKKIYGDLSARFTLVEFSETECPFCTKHHPTMKSLVDSSQGNINWEWKHLPLSFHNPAALQQAIVGECVAEQGGNRKFWVYIDEVFRLTAGNGKGVADLTGLVESLGVDMAAIRKCVGDPRAKQIVEADVDQAGKLNITGTPATIIVDNQTGNSHLISGAQPVGAFSAVIERMLKETASIEDGDSSAEPAVSPEA